MGRSGGARCVHCGAKERHRFVWLYFTRMTDLFDGRPKDVLHVAPERCFEPRLRRQLGTGYVTADLFDPRAMVKMDVTDIHYPDESFDVIYCSHVLEHVQDDLRAMREFYRVLKRGGWAVVLVPISAAHTFEDPSVVDPAERRRQFGQEDHVRRYGPDFPERLRRAGFEVTAIHVTDLLAKDEIERMELAACDDVYRCTRV
jgi:SAM-dependent methyltransferase